MEDTPKIRFRGFTDDWEQRKIKDIAPLQRGFDLPTSQMEEGIYPVVMSNGIGGQHSQYKVKGPGVVTGRSGTIGKLHYIETDYWPHNTTLWVTDFYGNNQKFIYYIYQYLDLSRFSTGSGVPTLNRNDVHNEVVCIPNVGEQKKISEHLTTLDRLITLHQRKCDDTKELKKYMLQKMFPQNGKKIPEIRFAGFTDDWEQRKVTDLGEIYIGLVTTMTAHYTNHGTLLIRNSDIKDSHFEFGDNPIYLDEDFAEKNSSRKHKLGDVITVHTGDIGTSAVITEKEVDSIGFATIITRPNLKEITSEFLCAYLNTDTHKKFAFGISTGDGRNNYNLKDYYECVIPVPDIKEQKKISNYIESLNRLITLHQRKCDELKKVKKFMLHNMFPQKG